MYIITSIILITILIALLLYIFKIWYFLKSEFEELYFFSAIQCSEENVSAYFANLLFNTEWP